MIRDLFLVFLGAVFSATWGFALPKTYDEKKWEAFEKNRVERRAAEAKFAACYKECTK